MLINYLDNFMIELLKVMGHLRTIAIFGKPLATKYILSSPRPNPSESKLGYG